jgi:hypothetical protein
MEIKKYMKKTYFSPEDATCYLLQGQDFMFSAIQKQKKDDSNIDRHPSKKQPEPISPYGTLYI